jgi:hypothetical protein
MAAKNLKDMSIAQLTVLYNDAALKLGQKTRKGFSTKPDALKRTKAILAELKGNKGKSGDGGPGRSVEFPLPAAKKLAHRVQENSIKGKLVAALRNGATREAMGKIVEAHDAEKGKKVKGDPSARAYRDMLILHRDIGYGIRQEGSKFFLEEPKE